MKDVVNSIPVRSYLEANRDDPIVVADAVQEARMLKAMEKLNFKKDMLVKFLHVDTRYEKRNEALLFPQSQTPN